MTVFAIVSTLDAGYNSERIKMNNLGIKIGDRFIVTDIDMGQSNTSIGLKEHSGHFNSVFFNFEENGKELNIYGDPRFNPYLNID